MALITHGSDLTLAPTLRHLAASVGAAPRRALLAVAEAGFHAVQLDATMPGLRPRELDQSARRDLGATIRRSGLIPAGIDFFIPADHYHDPQHIDRAVSSAHAAAQLAADLGRVPLSVNLPIPDIDERVCDDLAAAADGFGVRLAVHFDADPDRLMAWLGQQEQGVVDAGIDPAATLSARHDPCECLHRLSDRLCVARLSDAERGQADGTRSVVGRGDLDLTAYRVSVDLASRRTGPVVLDLRMLADPLAGAKAAAAAWNGAAMQM